MRLLIQIPCLNEEANLAKTIGDLPKALRGVSRIDVLVIDDGSTDATNSIAIQCGAEVVSFKRNRGLAAAFQAGLDYAVAKNYDLILNTDADNQYDASSIPDLIHPLVNGLADVSIGDRQTRSISEFSLTKKTLQALGSKIASNLIGSEILDAASGFRAYTSEAIRNINITNNYTYTLESLVQLSNSGMKIVNVPIKRNPTSRPSRLMKSYFKYVMRNGSILVNSYLIYKPIKIFLPVGALLLLSGLALFIPFLSDWLFFQKGGHIQSVLAGTMLTLAGIQVLLSGLVAETLKSTRIIATRRGNS